MEDICENISKYNLAFAFNGGKESIVVFDLIQKYIPKQKIIYFNILSENDFPD